MKSGRLRILVTGFGRFPGSRANPTAGLVRALGKYEGRLGLLGIALERAVLPVRYAGVGKALDALEKRFKPDAIVLFGLAARRRCFSIETTARNRVSILRCDASGARASSREILPGAPQSARATFPSREIAAALRQAGLKNRLSINAGAYICNEALYFSLARSNARAIGFIHVPRLRHANRPKAAQRRGRPAKGDLVRAALIAILLTARKLRQLDRGTLA